MAAEAGVRPARVLTREERVAINAPFQALVNRIFDAMAEIMTYEETHKVKVLSNEDAERMIDLKHAIGNSGSQAAAGRQVPEEVMIYYEAEVKWVESYCKGLLLRKAA